LLEWRRRTRAVDAGARRDLLDEDDAEPEALQARGPAQAHPRLAAVPGLVCEGAADNDRAHALADRTLLVTLDVQALVLAVVQVHDLRVRARRLPVGAVLDAREPGLEQHFLDKLAREQRARIAVPNELRDQLGAQAPGVLVGDDEVVAVAPLVRRNPFQQVREAQPE